MYNSLLTETISFAALVIRFWPCISWTKDHSTGKWKRKLHNGHEFSKNNKVQQTLLSVPGS